MQPRTCLIKQGDTHNNTNNIDLYFFSCDIVKPNLAIVGYNFNRLRLNICASNKTHQLMISFQHNQNNLCYPAPIQKKKLFLCQRQEIEELDLSHIDAFAYVPWAWNVLGLTLMDGDMHMTCSYLDTNVNVQSWELESLHLFCVGPWAFDQPMGRWIIEPLYFFL